MGASKRLFEKLNTDKDGVSKAERIKEDQILLYLNNRKWKSK